MRIKNLGGAARCILVAVSVLLIFAFGLSLAEERRTDAELNEIISAYLSDGILHNSHDWGAGEGILVVIQHEAQKPGLWRWRWLYPFDKRVRFDKSMFLTRCSFVLSNAIQNSIDLRLRLPKGIKAVMASRNDLERPNFTSDFQARFPNNLGYIAISHAGFNFDKTEAIFYIDHFCGLCGGGRYVLMRRVNNIWKIIDEHYTWIS